MLVCRAKQRSCDVGSSIVLDKTCKFVITHKAHFSINPHILSSGFLVLHLLIPSFYCTIHLVSKLYILQFYEQHVQILSLNINFVVTPTHTLTHTQTNITVTIRPRSERLPQLCGQVETLSFYSPDLSTYQVNYS